MRNLIAILVLLLAMQSFAGREYFFRVQCFEETDEVTDDQLSMIPEMEFYIKRTGAKIYFSGSAFVHYSDAKQRLETLKSRGLLSAFIRVFHRNVLLSGENHNKHYPIAVERSLQNETYIRRKEQEKIEFAKLDSIRTELKKNALAKAKKETNPSNGGLVKKSKSAVLAADSTENIKPINPAGLYVDEPVYFILQVGISLNGEGVPSKVEKIDQVVYQVQDGNNNIFYIGLFENLDDAISLQEKTRNSVDGTRIIGLYKGRVISLSLAQELSAIYLSGK